jgi:GxxExxY protein
MRLRNRSIPPRNVVATGEEQRVEEDSASVFDDEPLKEKLVSCITEIYQALGTGRRESVYVKALQVKLSRSNIDSLAEYPVPLMFESKKVGCAYLDLLVPNKYFFEVKANAKISIRDVLQTRAYSRETMLAGFLVNFPQQTGNDVNPEIFLLEGNLNSETLSRTSHSLVIQ